MTTSASTASRPTRWRRIRRSPFTHLLLAVVLLALVQGFVRCGCRALGSAVSPCGGGQRFHCCIGLATASADVDAYAQRTDGKDR